MGRPKGCSGGLGRASVPGACPGRRRPARRVPRAGSRGPRPRPGTGTRRKPGQPLDPWSRAVQRSRAVQNRVHRLVRSQNQASPTMRGLARSKTASTDWYATRNAPFGGFHAHIQGWGRVRTRWIARGSAYQSVHTDLGRGVAHRPDRRPRATHAHIPWTVGASAHGSGGPQLTKLAPSAIFVVWNPSGRGSTRCTRAER